MGPVGDDVFAWEASIKGPDGTPYEDGTFKLSVAFPPDFPFKPPSVKFATKMYHCNVSEGRRLHGHAQGPVVARAPPRQGHEGAALALREPEPGRPARRGQRCPLPG